MEEVGHNLTRNLRLRPLDARHGNLVPPEDLDELNRGLLFADAEGNVYTHRGEGYTPIGKLREGPYPLRN